MAASVSLRLRLLIGTLVAITAAMLLAWLFIADVYAAHVRRVVEEDLGHHLTELIAHTRVGADGAVEVYRPLSDPRFQQPGSGMSWQIERGGRLYTSASATPAAVPGAGTIDRRVRLAMGGAPLTFAIREDGRLLDAEIAAFHSDLTLSLAALALLLGIGLALQHRVGLRPLGRLGDAVDALRRGQIDRLPEDVPAEFRGLVVRLNGVLDSHAVLIDRARLEAGNLAHGLRTPLALIDGEADGLRHAGRAGSADFIQEQCALAGRYITYHLRRASAGGTRGLSAATPLPPILKEIVTAMDRLHRRAGLQPIALAVPDTMIRADREDMIEVFSNLIDNACKWARWAVSISAHATADRVIVIVDDDGPGVSPDALGEILTAGTRLDQAKPGYGLGLAIASDLLALNAGGLALANIATGGFRATVTLQTGADEGTSAPVIG